MFKALGDPTRLRALYFLEDGEKSVLEIVFHVGLAQPTVSRHLRVLFECGLVTTRREANKILYSISSPEIYKILGNIDNTLLERLKKTILERMKR